MKEEFISLLEKIEREGMDKLIEFLKHSDFFEAPASTKFHGCYAGGLLEHSMKVYEILKEKVKNCSIDKKLVDYAVEELTKITGQKAVATISKKDVASFKLRKGMPIGAKVTLRGERMYEFLDRLITSALPRVRDFSGIKSNGFDGRGNYNLGVVEQIIFPEIDIDKVKKFFSHSNLSAGISICSKFSLSINTSPVPESYKNCIGRLSIYASPHLSPDIKLSSLTTPLLGALTLILTFILAIAVLFN